MKGIIGLQLRAAAIRNPDAGARTAEVMWSSGAAVKRIDWFAGETFLEELSLDPKHVRMDRLNSGAPLLNSHGTWSLSDVIGVVERAAIEGGSATATVRFSNRPEVDSIWRDVQDGIIRNVSVGYKVHKYEDVTDYAKAKPGERTVKILRAVDWEPFELSAVPVGADPKAGFRSGSDENECEIITQTLDGNSADHPDAARQGPPADTLAAIRERFEFMHRNA